MRKIRVGIFGMNRGYDNMNNILVNDGEIVAICDMNEKLLARAKERLGDVAAYTDFDSFIEHDMDAVYLANFFNEHAPYAIRALEKGIHVISECTANGTMAEGVALVRAAEKSGAIYMLAENYPYMLFNQEMRKVYAGGTLGKFFFGEGEYNHPVAATDAAFVQRYYTGLKHWRNYLPRTYYITHSLGPLMCATHSNPIRVMALPIYAPECSTHKLASVVADSAAIIMTQNDDDSVFRITGCAGFGAHENSYRLACEKGQIENVRGGGGRVMLRYNSWDVPEGKQPDNYYFPEEDPDDAVLAKSAGHAGGDYYMFKEFLDCVRTGRRPYLDVYVATTMASVAILGHRSLMERGVPYDIPDFHKEEDRKKYENDTLSPFWGADGSAPTIEACSHPEYRPSEAQIAKFNEIMTGKQF